MHTTISLFAYGTRVIQSWCQLCVSLQSEQVFLIRTLAINYVDNETFCKKLLSAKLIIA